MPHLEESYRKDTNIISRQIAGEMILVPIRQKMGDLDCIFRLNETAARAWDLLDGQRTLAEIRDQLSEEFEVEPMEAGQDLVGLMDQLESCGAASKA